MADSSFDPPRSRKLGRFDIITLTRFIDEVVVGTYNKIMKEDGRDDKVMDMRPFHSKELMRQTGDSAEKQGKFRRFITYRITENKIASLTRGTKDLVPRLRETYENSDVNAIGTPMTTEVYGRWKDYRIRFDCFCQTWKESQELLLDFEELMLMSRKYIEGQGAVKFIQEDGSSDSYKYATEYFYETIYFTARLEQLQIITGEALQRFEVSLDKELMQTVR